MKLLITLATVIKRYLSGGKPGEANAADTAVSAALAALGLVSLATGTFFTYQTYFHHPKYSYIPADEQWREYLQQLRQQSSSESNQLQSNSGQSDQNWEDLSTTTTQNSSYQYLNPESSEAFLGSSSNNLGVPTVAASSISQNSDLEQKNSLQERLQGIVKSVVGTTTIATPSGQQLTFLTNQPNLITVDVSGAVLMPGAYQLSQDSRLQDAILLAGGFANQADRQYIHQQLNLADKLSDQQKIYIPSTGEDIQLVAQITAYLKNQIPEQWQVVSQPSQEQEDEPNYATGTNDTKTIGSHKIDVNSATKDQLMSIKNIGEKRAEDIISGRPYSDHDDFCDRSGLSSNLCQEILTNDVFVES